MTKKKSWSNLKHEYNKLLKITLKIKKKYEMMMRALIMRKKLFLHEKIMQSRNFI
jgi:hypothetical protein